MATVHVIFHWQTKLKTGSTAAFSDNRHASAYTEHALLVALCLKIRTHTVKVRVCSCKQVEQGSRCFSQLI